MRTSLRKGSGRDGPSGRISRLSIGGRIRFRAKVRMALCSPLLLAACAPAWRMPNRAPAAEDCNGCVPRGSRTGVRFQFDPWMPGGDSASVLTVVFDDGRQVRTTHSTEWNDPTRGRWSPYFETAARRGGSLRVTAILQSPAGDTLAVGTAVREMRRDWQVGLLWQITRWSTLGTLPGIDAVRWNIHFPLRGEEGKPDPVVLWVMTGTRSISRPTPH
jgi:hypothetical protein